MKIAKKTAFLIIVISAISGAIVSFLVLKTDAPSSEHHFQLAFSLSLLALFIITSGLFAYYQKSLKIALKNLDEAQKIAKMGSWERDIATGEGYWSKNRYRLFGLKPRKKAPSASEFHSMLHHEDRAKVEEAYKKAVETGEGYEVSYRLAADKENRIFLSRATVILSEDGKPQSVVGTTQDITDKMAQQLANAAIMHQKDIFISKLGHDLNTPLTPLITLLPLIQGSITDERQLKRINLCIDSANLIKTVVASSMQLARRFQPLKKPLVIEKTSINSLIQEVMADMRDSLQSNAMIIDNSVTEDISVMADRSEIKIVLSQIISNGINFSPAGSIISISSARDGDMVKISLHDKGIGISKEDLPHIFDEFYKADRARHNLASSGLGLSICREIIKNHGGEIYAESDGVDKGATIFFTLQSGGDILKQ